MSISVDNLVSPLLGEGYSPAPGIYDEMSSAPGVFRPHWDAYLASLSEIGREELARRWRTARQRIRENGVSYNVYGDPLGMDRPWNLDAIPILISPTEWRELEAGLIQRARLLNWMLADLYGPQKLLRGGHIPPALVFANPGFLAACHGLPCRTTPTCICSPWIWRARPTASGGCFRTARRRLRARVMRSRTASSWRRRFRICSASSRSSDWLRFFAPSATSCCSSRLR